MEISGFDEEVEKSFETEWTDSDFDSEMISSPIAESSRVGDVEADDDHSLDEPDKKRSKSSFETIDDAKDELTKVKEEIKKKIDDPNASQQSTKAFIEVVLGELIDNVVGMMLSQEAMRTSEDSKKAKTKKGRKRK